MTPDIIIQKLKINGMTCAACENKVTKKLKNTKGVINAKVSYAKGYGTVTFDANIISLAKIIKAIDSIGYTALLWEKRNEKIDYSNMLSVAIIIFALYTIIKHFGFLNIFNSFPQAKEGMGYGMLFIIGILTSLHCIAMCGGINLSQCVPQKSYKTNENKLLTLRPSFLYNFGRIISYTIVGAIVGAIGSAVNFSPAAKGIVQLAAGIFMIIMGLNMLNMFPWLKKLMPRMPKIIANKLGEHKKSNSPLYVGLLNGLMPCGPLQAMQLYALSTGSPLKGALSMLIFSLGTMPLMFGLGALSSYLSKKFTKKVMSASAVMVIVLGVFMLSYGMNLSGITVSTPKINTNISASQSGNPGVAVIKDDMQTVTTRLASRGYSPITVQKGIPVKWNIQVNQGDLNGCNNSIIIPEFNKSVQLKTGDNIIEFTPTQSGTFAYSCWMGMIKSSITVVDYTQSK